MKLNKLGDNLLHNDNLCYTYLRSIVSSQVGSWADTIVSFVLFALAGLTPWFSTALGAFAGGVVNFIINYRFTFHAYNCDLRALVVKYAMIWTGSLLLNSFGTQFVYYVIKDWDWLQDIGFRKDGYFLAARLFVSLVVSCAWNFMLQRYFVYRVVWFDKYAVRFVKLLGFGSAKGLVRKNEGN